MNVPATNTMIVLTIRSVTTPKVPILALVKMVTTICLDLTLYQAEFAQVIRPQIYITASLHFLIQTNLCILHCVRYKDPYRRVKQVIFKVSVE